MGRTILKRLALLLLVGALPACFDEVPDPDQGFIEVDPRDGAGVVPGVEVLVDGVAYGGSLEVGPLDAGVYTVAVRRPGYEIVPAERTVEVRGGRTARAEFTLTLAFTGAVRVAARDEVRGTEVAGAEILVDLGGGAFEPSGAVTPAIVARLPPGEVRFVMRRDGYLDSDPVSAEVVVADTVETNAELGPPRAVLGEMFTYVICPNCPASAAMLEELHEEDPTGFYAIEWHTWSGLPLYDARWRIREAYYTGGGSVGWPATVFQGGAFDDPVLLIGSDASELAEYRARTDAARAACGNDCPVAIVADGAISAAGVDVTVRALWRGGTLPGALMLRAVLIENDVQSPGNQPYFGFVARDMWEEAIAWSAAGEVLVRTVTMPVSPAWDLEPLFLVLFVQSDATREVLAVTGLP